MSDELIEKQAKKLFGHMKDYQQASELLKKGEAAIFSKHRQGDGSFGPGLRDELNKCRETFANEWGAAGWRNQEFARQQITEAQRPTEADIKKMHQDNMNPEPDANQPAGQREEFLDNLKAKREGNQQKPHRPRNG